MNENLDLTKILKDCPKGTKLYSTVYGDVTLNHIDIDDDKYPILVNIDYDGYESFTKDGRMLEDYNAECVLFPSKDNRDWSTFKVPNKLPKTWEEFCKIYPIKKDECFISSTSVIAPFEEDHVYRDRYADKNMFPNKYYAEAMLALCQLIQLRDCYNNGWTPDYKNTYQKKYCIYYSCDKMTWCTNLDYQEVLTFKTPELRDEFLNNFRELIQIAKPLI